MSGASGRASIFDLSSWRGLAILLVAIVAPLWHLHVINRGMPPNKADMVAVWKGAQATFHGHDPYGNATTEEIQRFYYGRILTPKDNVNPMGFAYPMHTIILFAPIAWLPWPILRLALLVLLTLATVASVLLWIRVVELNPSRKTLVTVALLSLFSWPSMWGIHQIQPTIVVGFLVAAGCYLVKRGNMATAGFLFALATIKPQLIAILILWLLLWTALQDSWRLLVSFCLTLAALLASATCLLPTWVHSWRTSIAEYAVYRHLQLDLQTLYGFWLGLFLVAVIGALGLTVLWQQRHCAPASREFGAMCALSLALTVCFLPTERAMVYNHILLFPACFLIISTKPDAYYAALARLLATGLIIWSFASIPMAVLGETIFGLSDFWDSFPFITQLLPTAVAVALACTFLRGKTAQIHLQAPIAAKESAASIVSVQP